jgi:hypothetical protein
MMLHIVRLRASVAVSAVGPVLWTVLEQVPAEGLFFRIEAAAFKALVMGRNFPDCFLRRNMMAGEDARHAATRSPSEIPNLCH